MHIRKGVFVAVAGVFATLFSVTQASINLESTIVKEMNVEQAQTINFWSNFRTFSWGLFLGIPGTSTQSASKNCYNSAFSLYKALELAYNNTQLYPDRTAEQLTGDIYNIFNNVVNVGNNCAAMGQRILDKINNFRDLVNYFLQSEQFINSGDFYNSGQSLGFAISKMIA